MQVQTHKRYDAMWVKLDRKQQLQVMTALKLFMTSQNKKQLRDVYKRQIQIVIRSNRFIT